MSTILLVDDDIDLAETLKEWFEMEGHEADVVFDGVSALKKMLAGSYDIIILDWQLPGLDGLEVCRQYRANGGNASVLMLTGKRDSLCQEAGRDAGVTDFLPKPFTLDKLMERFQRIVLPDGAASTE